MDTLEDVRRSLDPWTSGRLTTAGEREEHEEQGRARCEPSRSAPRFYGSHEVGLRIWAVEGFPEPAAELHQGPIWDGDEVDAWAEAVRSAIGDERQRL